jgi:hypothetical protein
MNCGNARVGSSTTSPASGQSTEKTKDQDTAASTDEEDLLVKSILSEWRWTICHGPILTASTARAQAATVRELGVVQEAPNLGGLIVAKEHAASATGMPP